MNIMKHKLNPCLYSATLDARKNLWQIFVIPLFEVTLPVYYYEDSISNKHKLEQILRKSFKYFTGLGRNISTPLIEALMGSNLKTRGQHVQYISEKKSRNLE